MKLAIFPSQKKQASCVKETPSVVLLVITGASFDTTASCFLFSVIYQLLVATFMPLRRVLSEDGFKSFSFIQK